jgi:hypothetical protein
VEPKGNVVRSGACCVPVEMGIVDMRLRGREETDGKK